MRSRKNPLETFCVRLVRRVKACGRKATLACGEVCPVGMLRPCANGPVPVSRACCLRLCRLLLRLRTKFQGLALLCRRYGGWRLLHCPFRIVLL